MQLCVAVERLAYSLVVNKQLELAEGCPEYLPGYGNGVLIRSKGVLQLFLWMDKVAEIAKSMAVLLYIKPNSVQVTRHIYKFA
jgi:hypothetical protein